MNLQKLVMIVTTATGGAAGLLAPIGFVKWLLRTDPEEAGILTLFFFPVWCRAQGKPARDRRQAGRAEMKRRSSGHDRFGKRVLNFAMAQPFGSGSCL